MASQDRMSPDDLTFLQSIEEAPFQADFNAVLRAVECIYSGHARLGETLRPSEDPIRLGQEVTLSFPPAPLASFRGGSHGDRRQLLVNFFGMLGPNGPMPLHITEYIYERTHHFNDKTLESFLDIFHHRLISLFYRAWANSEATVSLDRPKTDRFGTYVASLIGLGQPSLRNRDAMPDWCKLHYSGLLSCQTRHPDGLQAILSGFFNAPVTVEEFVGRWITLPPECLCQIGFLSGNTSLGDDTTLGDRVWDYQQTFRIVIGPLNLDIYQRMLPGSDGLHRLTSIVQNYVGFELAWDLQLILKQDEIPRICLGEQGCLGWTAWLQHQPMEKNAEDLVLSLEAA